MNLTGETERNHAALMRIVAGLFTLARIVPGERPELDPEAKSDSFMTSLPRYVYKAVMLILVPAEAAMRRLLIIAAYSYGLDLKVQSKPSGFGKDSKDRPQNWARPSDPEKPWRGRTSFNMFDPMKSFEDYWLPELAENRKPFPSMLPEPQRIAPVNAVTLWQRINALHDAVSDLPKAAQRYARWHARSNFARANNLLLRPRRLGLTRPGYAPGYDEKHIHEVQNVLRECHMWVGEIQSPPPWRESNPLS